MRFQRSLALLAVTLAWLALGPLVLLVPLVVVVVPRSRARLWDWLRPTWRGVGTWVAALAALAGLVVLVPDGWLPVPPGPGGWVTPEYIGRPALAHPIRMEVPRSTGSASESRVGPLGESPDVDTAWYGLEQCGTLEFDSRDRLVALCGGQDGPSLRVVDPDTMRPLATKDLPDSDAKLTPTDLCAGSFYLDDADRAVVTTTDRQVLVVETDDAQGDPDLTTRAGHDLSGQVPRDDCLVAVLPDGQGRIWFATQQGRVGTLEPRTGRASVLDLGEEIANPLAVDRDGTYVVTTEALYRLRASAGEGPTVTWRAAYDGGSGQKPGQLSQGSGTTPTLLSGGLVAITDNADPKMHVVFYRRGDGEMVCQSAVFDDDESATESALVAVGSGVIVENNHGYGDPLSTMLGRTTEAGLARVDVTGGRCSVGWASQEVAPTSAPTVSLATGLVYAYTKRHSWWGADAWYLTALDARTGRTVFSVRTGLGTLLDGRYAAVTLAPDGSAYIPTRGGLVRVRDRSQG